MNIYDETWPEKKLKFTDHRVMCPVCCEELYDTKPSEVLMTIPPKIGVHCDCGYIGYRIDGIAREK